MPNAPSNEPDDHELIEEMEKLEKAVRASVIPTSRQILRGFLTGISSALGALVAAAIIIPILIYALKNVEWIPLIGTFFIQISQYMERGR